jgi:hypothetical protein
MTQQEIILDLPMDAQRLLADNGIDLIRALRDSGLEIKRSTPSAAVPHAEGGKEPVLAILAVGVTASLIAAGVAKILDALGRNKKFLVTEYELLPVAGRDGKTVRDASNNPVLYWSEKKRLLEATQIAQDRSTSSLDVHVGPTLLKFSTKSGN